MAETFHSIRDILAELESLQRQAGELQLNLLKIVTDERQDEWDEPAQAALLKLETVQRTIGEAQVVLVQRIPTSCPVPCDSESSIHSSKNEAKGRRPEKEPHPPEPGTKGPIKWLQDHAIRVKPSPPQPGWMRVQTAQRSSLVNA